jgi:DNA primase
LLQRIPAGVYRELLLDRLAAAVRMPATKLAGLLIEPAAAPPPTARARVSTRASAGMSAGRGSLVRQAIVLLLNFPEAARDIAKAEGLAGLTQPGVSLLAELIADLKSQPAPHKAAVVERWRERPEGLHLMKLAAIESLVADSRAAAGELQMAVERLLEATGPAERTDALLKKAEATGLTAQEKLELQELLNSSKGSRAGPRGA